MKPSQDLSPEQLERNVCVEVEKYINDRLHVKQCWYEKRAQHNKNAFLRTQSVIIILSVMIPLVTIMEPVLTGLGNLLEKQIGMADIPSWGAVVAAALSAIISIFAGMDKLTQPQANWLNYHANEKALRKEEWMYRCRVGPYSSLDDIHAAKLLVERVEHTIAAETSRFAELVEQGAEEMHDSVSLRSTGLAGMNTKSAAPVPTRKQPIRTSPSPGISTKRH